jgi:hypothetical protein
MHSGSGSNKAKSYSSCGSGSSSTTLVSAKKLLAHLQSLGHQNADIPVAIIPALLLSAMFTVSVVAFFQPVIVGPTAADVPAIASFFASLVSLLLLMFLLLLLSMLL